MDRQRTKERRTKKEKERSPLTKLLIEEVLELLALGSGILDINVDTTEGEERRRISA